MTIFNTPPLSDDEVHLLASDPEARASATLHQILALADEVWREREARRAGAAHVERVVREAYANAHRAVACPRDWDMGKLVAIRVADRLSAPAASAVGGTDWSAKLRACADSLRELAETYIVENGQVMLRSSIRTKP